MDKQIIYNWIIGILMAVLGWLGRTLWDAVERLRRDLQAVEVNLPSTYVKQSDMKERFDKIEDILERIFDKLDHKADR